MFYCVSYYVAAKATYIRLLHGKIGILESFSALAPYNGVGPICSVHPPLHTLKIWGGGVYSPRS